MTSSGSSPIAKRTWAPCLDRLDRLESTLAAALDRWKVWVLAVFSITYLVIASALAWHKLLWNDELFTLYIARLPTYSDIWSLLASGVEQFAADLPYPRPPVLEAVRRESLGLAPAGDSRGRRDEPLLVRRRVAPVVRRLRPGRDGASPRHACLVLRYRGETVWSRARMRRSLPALLAVGGRRSSPHPIPGRD
jgi:hypothetical protein